MGCMNTVICISGRAPKTVVGRPKLSVGHFRDPVCVSMFRKLTFTQISLLGPPFRRRRWPNSVEGRRISGSHWVTAGDGRLGFPRYAPGPY